MDSLQRSLIHSSQHNMVLSDSQQTMLKMLTSAFAIHKEQEFSTTILLHRALQISQRHSLINSMSIGMPILEIELQKDLPTYNTDLYMVFPKMVDQSILLIITMEKNMTHVTSMFAMVWRLVDIMHMSQLSSSHISKDVMDRVQIVTMLHLAHKTLGLVEI